MNAATPAHKGTALGVFAAGLLLYARTLGYDFVDWDDTVHVVNNPWVHGLSLENLRLVFTHGISNSFFPLQSVSYMIDYTFWELDPFGYHLHSVLLNAVNGVLAFVLLSMLSRSAVVAGVGALLFAVHPSHVAPVAWVTARKELLFGAFVLLSTIFYLRARRAAGGLDARAYAISLACFALGAAAKPTIAVYPLFFVLLDWVEESQRPAGERRPLAPQLANKLPYLLLALPFVWMNFQVQLVADRASLAEPLDYVLLKGHAAWRYFWLLFGALPGQPIYDAPTLRTDALSVVGLLAPFVALPAALGLALRRGWREPALALGWLGAGLAAPLAFPLTTYMADRYLYMPSLGFCWALALGIAALAARARRSATWQTFALVAFTAALATSFASTAWRYTPAWRDSLSLWSYAIRYASDGRIPTALSASLIRIDELDAAQRVLEDFAPQLGPNGWLHLAIVHLKRESFEKAVGATNRALALAEDQPPSPTDLGKLLVMHGIALNQLGDTERAVKSWETALAVDPNNAQAQELVSAVREAGGESP